MLTGSAQVSQRSVCKNVTRSTLSRIIQSQTSTIRLLKVIACKGVYMCCRICLNTESEMSV